MKIWLQRLIFTVASLNVVWFIGISFVEDRAAAQDTPLMAEQVFKNIQALKGLPWTISSRRWDHDGRPSVRLLGLSHRRRPEPGKLGG